MDDVTATVVDPATADAIRHAAGCEAHLDTHTTCSKPAAWLVTFVIRANQHNHGPILMCTAHKDETVGHVTRCPLCRHLYDITSEPLR